ncbi:MULTISPECIES: glutaredoxin 3 [unclassified Moraxella]|uniref:glutaredoxin 3 n=1 Tax=unclassified Moraxella TaxID=2685852 RepID=UPI003AF92B21
MATVKIYSTPVCPYCSQAKMLLKNKGVDFEDIGMMNLSAEERQALAQKTNNYRTVPQIFIGDEFIGGFDQLSALEREGKLDTMLAN